MFEWLKSLCWWIRDPKKNFMAFRKRLLSGGMVSLAQHVSDPNGIYAVVMEIGVTAKDFISVAAFFDGDAFLFANAPSEGLMPELPQRVGKAAAHMCVLGAGARRHASLVDRFEFPFPGEVVFYFLTRTGTEEVRETRVVLDARKDALYLAGCQVAEEMRVVKKEMAGMGFKKSF